MTNSSKQPQTSQPTGEHRRSFLGIAVALLAGAIATLTPLVVGVMTFLSPLLRRSRSLEVRIALLSQVPADGMPRMFPVAVDREDAWNRYPQQKVGAVYLVRQPEQPQPIAFTAKCPHAGCFIGYAEGDELFKCPCHTSAFKLDGSRAKGDAEVSPRDMDQLPVQLKQIDGADDQSVTEVWVEFIDFQTGKKEQVPTV